MSFHGGAAMRVVLAIVVLAILVSPVLAEKSESKLFLIGDGMCSWEWLRSQGAESGVGLYVGASDSSEEGYYRVDFVSGAGAEERVNQGWTTWRYTYIFMNCGERPLIFFTVPGLGSSANEAIQDALGRMKSAIQLEAGQGLRLVFYDHRAPKTEWVMVWFMSTFDSSIRSEGSIVLPVPDPTLPKY